MEMLLCDLSGVCRPPTLWWCINFIHTPHLSRKTTAIGVFIFNGIKFRLWPKFAYLTCEKETEKLKVKLSWSVIKSFLSFREQEQSDRDRQASKKNLNITLKPKRRPHTFFLPQRRGTHSLIYEPRWAKNVVLCTLFKRRRSAAAACRYCLIIWRHSYVNNCLVWRLICASSDAK